ncbi:MAG: hypothetical protein SCALA702_32790 [Melioribacteraceae bacterium]|nr:MAG: hypothetical protein SCALA702_32790 [Melioribacteraceae bacterium]
MNSNPIKNYLIYTLLVLSIFACKHTPVENDEVNKGSIKGYVRESSSMAYISLATVVLDETTVTTDSDGNYSILGLEQGEYSLLAFKPGYDTTSVKVYVNAGDTSRANFFLTEKATLEDFGAIKGFVRDISTTELIDSVIISTGDSLYLTDITGNYHIQYLEPGYYDLSATKAGYDTMSLRILAEVGVTSVANFYLNYTGEAPPTPEDTVTAIWEFDNTGTNHTISVPSSVAPTIKGAAIQPGDLIGVFYDSSGVDACAGYSVWTGNNIPVTAWGNDNTTSEKDGFSTGEAFRWKIKDVSTGKSYNAVATYASGDETFVSNGLTIVATLKVE